MNKFVYNKPKFLIRFSACSYKAETISENMNKFKECVVPTILVI